LRRGNDAVVDFLWFLLVGLAAGWLAGQITRGAGWGIVGNLVVGVLGAVVGGALFRVVGFVAYGLAADLISATIGAVLLLFLLSRITR
jgi:uncharacterized membrane protein YeaQ/YmgE (transglycosylase-associated protein family)